MAADIEEVLEKLDANRLLEDTYRFVDIPSPTGDEANFCTEYAAFLEWAGFDVTIDREFPASPSAIGRRPGADPGAPVLQLEGHTDAIVVPHKPATIDREQGIVRGRGAADMKGGLAALGHAVHALVDAGVTLNGGLLMTAHGLHEAPGGDSRTLRSLLKRGIKGDSALVAELSHNSVPIAAKGMSIFRVEICREGDVMHEVELGRREENPLSALRLLLEKLDRLDDELETHTAPLVGKESLFVGEVHGGDFYNRVPVRVEVVGTRRYVVPHTRDDAEAELAALCHDVAKDTGFRVEVTLQEVGAAYELDASLPIVRAVQRGYLLATGEQLEVSGASAVGNATDLVSHGVPAVYHGVNQTTAHSDDEFVTRDDLLRAARVYAASIVEFSGIADGKKA